jgi:hypothetical protein
MTSTWFQATNSVLNLAQLPLITSTANFDAGTLTKYQNAAKYKIDFANRHLCLKVVTTMSNRKFPLDIVQGTTDYALNTGILSENLKYHSWFNKTAGSPCAGALPLVKYEDYETWWPDQTVIPQGPPEYVVQLPYDSVIDATGLNPMIRIFPVPDNSYTLEYQAHLNALPLTVNSSPISWPPQYEHGLWGWAWKFLEIDLAEGREQMLDSLVDEVVTRIKLASQTAEEVRKGVRMMKLSSRRGYGYGYNGGYSY